jgi:hypothetical protein
MILCNKRYGLVQYMSLLAIWKRAKDAALLEHLKLTMINHKYSSLLQISNKQLLDKNM